MPKRRRRRECGRYRGVAAAFVGFGRYLELPGDVAGRAVAGHVANTRLEFCRIRLTGVEDDLMRKKPPYPVADLVDEGRHRCTMRVEEEKGPIVDTSDRFGKEYFDDRVWVNTLRSRSGVHSDVWLARVRWLAFERDDSIAHHHRNGRRPLDDRRLHA